MTRRTSRGRPAPPAAEPAQGKRNYTHRKWPSLLIGVKLTTRHAGTTAAVRDSHPRAASARSIIKCIRGLGSRNGIQSTVVQVDPWIGMDVEGGALSGCWIHPSSQRP